MDGETSVYESPLFANQDEREVEACVQKSVNCQYTIVLSDRGNDGWSQDRRSQWKRNL